MLTVGPIAENCFLLRREGSDRALIVDPGEEAERILAAVEEMGVEVDAILLTHCHFDHIGAVAPVADGHRRARLLPGDRGRRCSPTSWPSSPAAGFGPFESYDADETVGGGETLELAGLELDVIFTPGHSPGHVTYSVRGEEAIFSGDVLFQGSVGRVDLPGGDGPTLMSRSARLLESHPAETTVYPGHMGDDHARRRAGDQPVPRRAGRGRRRGAAQVRSRHDGEQVPGTPRDLRRPARGARARGAGRARRGGDLRPRRLRADRDAGLRGHRAVRARRRPLHRHRPQGDVHLRGQGRAQHHPAPGGHGADLPRLPRARHAQAGAAGEALLRRAVLPPRAPAGRPLPPVPPDRRWRRSAPTRRSPTPRRSCCSPTCSPSSACPGSSCAWAASARSTRAAPTWRS